MTKIEKIERLEELEEKIKYDIKYLILYFSGSTTFLIAMLSCIKDILKEDNNYKIYVPLIISLIYAFKFDIKLYNHKLSVLEKNTLKLEIDMDNMKNY